nr:hypothetical protein Itr_chr13CG13690 [Ipomoea trifida]
MASSIFEPVGLSLAGLEILIQSSLSVDGVLPNCASHADGSIDRLKHQFLPLIGNTISRALTIDSNGLSSNFSTSRELSEEEGI